MPLPASTTQGPPSPAWILFLFCKEGFQDMPLSVTDLALLYYANSNILLGVREPHHLSHLLV